MIDDEGYYYHSDHVLDNMTPEEELAVSMFQHALSSGKINPAAQGFDDGVFEKFLELSERIVDILEIRHAEADADAAYEMDKTNPKAKFKVVPMDEVKAHKEGINRQGN